MKTILTLKYGDKYTSEDVNVIYNSIPGNYNRVCVTDNPIGLNKNIKTIPLGDEIEGHWEKIKLFKLENLGKVLYLDLDIRIQKGIEHLWKMLDKNPIICYTYWKPQEFPYHKDDRWSYNYLSNFNSSVMMWEDNRHIYDYWEKNKDYYMVKYAGDDRFLFHECFTFEHFPKNEVYSFWFDGGKIKDATIALLNGQESVKEDIAKRYDELRMYQMGK